jgi:hypothetical protein
VIFEAVGWAGRYFDVAFLLCGDVDAELLDILSTLIPKASESRWLERSRNDNEIYNQEKSVSCSAVQSLDAG